MYVDVAAYLKQSPAVSGVPIKVSDSQTLLEIARLLRHAGIREHNGAEYPAIWRPAFDTERGNACN